MRLGSEYILTSSPQANYGYKQDDIVMLTDDASNPPQIPTRDNIVSVRGSMVRKRLRKRADCSDAVARARCAAE